ncbi:hypothetical protein LY90DRAFT_667225 [Neocallimastix californiae]|uniref:Uncharacterized protein n=1 Tax=Neocallimastix californiae TaxID=1754190 RepID=A0A1Y2ELC2_9FUNG|nr:hypothetical protein LY90DRAFT_667225 [Neocallimastix californiae]|eukprot:ORY72352.1 hypothetical protein LY90DRAFT_667225 [Neocallimastix californiae]
MDSSVFLPIKSIPEYTLPYNINHSNYPDFLTPISNSNTFIPIKSNFDLNSPLNMMASLPMNPTFQYNDFLKSNPLHDIPTNLNLTDENVSTTIAPTTTTLTTATTATATANATANANANATVATNSYDNDISNPNNFCNICPSNSFGLMNDNFLIQNYHQESSSNEISPFCFLNNNAIDNNNTFDFTTTYTTNKIGMNSLGTITGSSTNSLITPETNQNLNPLSFNICNHAFSSGNSIDLLNNNDKGLSLMNKFISPSSSSPTLQKQNDAFSPKNFDLLSSIPYPQFIDLMNNHPMDNKVATTTKDSHHLNININNSQNEDDNNKTGIDFSSLFSGSNHLSASTAILKEEGDTEDDNISTKMMTDYTLQKEPKFDFNMVKNLSMINNKNSSLMMSNEIFYINYT